MLHIEQGSEAGTDGWFHNSAAQVSAHFGVSKAGALQQCVDTNDKAWAITSGSRYWISVENEREPREPLTVQQMREVAKVLAWLHVTEGVPLVKTDSTQQRGLGWHGMGCEEWGHPTVQGHRLSRSGTTYQSGAELYRRRRRVASNPAPSQSMSPFVSRHPALRSGSTGDALVHARALLGVRSSTN